MKPGWKKKENGKDMHYYFLRFYFWIKPREPARIIESTSVTCCVDNPVVFAAFSMEDVKSRILLLDVCPEVAMNIQSIPRFEMLKT